MSYKYKTEELRVAEPTVAQADAIAVMYASEIIPLRELSADVAARFIASQEAA